MRKPQLTTLLSICIVLLALAARLIPGPRTIDDSYITFRYARNLLAGEGFVYNPGQPVQGTTTPLYTFLMAGLGLLTGGVNANFPLNAWLFNALADALTCYLLIRLGAHLAGRRGVRWAGYAVALVWSIAPYSVTFSIGGLETSLYVLLLTGLALAYAKRRRVLTGLLGALAVLTRPDAVLLVGPLILDRLVRAVRKTDEPLSLRELAAFLVPTLGWVLFATLTFGSPVPHSVQAKLGAYRLDDYAALIRLIQHYATPFMEQNLIGSALAVGLGLVVYPFLYVIGTRRIHKSEPRLLAWLVYPGLYFLAFALPNPLIFRWYLTPPLPAYFLGILAGVETLAMGKRYAADGMRYDVRGIRQPVSDDRYSVSGTRYPVSDTRYPESENRYSESGTRYPASESPNTELPNTELPNTELPNTELPNTELPNTELPNTDLPNTGERSSSSFSIQHSSFSISSPLLRRVLLLILLLLPTFFSLTEWRLHPDHGANRPAPEMAWYRLELLYRQAADFVAPQMNADSVLAAGDVGVLGYYTPARILDTVGLNSTEALKYYPLDPAYYVINYAIAPRLILDQQPDWVILLEVYGRNGLLPDPQYQAQYELVKKIPTDIYGSDGMLIFEKRKP